MLFRAFFVNSNVVVDKILGIVEIFHAGLVKTLNHMAFHFDFGEWPTTIFNPRLLCVGDFVQKIIHLFAGEAFVALILSKLLGDDVVGCTIFRSLGLTGVAHGYLSFRWGN